MMITGTLIALVALAIFALPTIFKSFGINQEYERAVLFRLGRLGEAKGPGWYWLIPWVDRVAHRRLGRLNDSALPILDRGHDLRRIPRPEP